MSGSLPTLKVMLRVRSPLLVLVLVMYSMPSTPLICCSMGVAMESTTVLQSAPG